MSLLKRILGKKPEPDSDPALIIPLLRTRIPGSGLSAEIPPEYHPIVEPLVADILVCYAFDMTAQHKFVSQADCVKLGIDPRNLRKHGLKNLRRRYPEFDLRRIDECWMVTGASGGYETVALLDDSFWAVRLEGVQGKVVAAAPSFDVLTVTTTKFPNGVDTVREVIEQTFKEGHHLLSRNLLTRTGTSWQLFDGKS
jgi:uncharacterized protein YtpQ (UPF0354 family)